MATQEEIIKQYQEDRNLKLLQLQTTLSSRIAQVGKQSAEVINGVSIISTPSVADDIVSKERVLKFQNNTDSKFANDLRNEFVSKNANTTEPFAYLVMFPRVSYVKENEVSIQISEILFFRKPGGTDENIDSFRNSPKIEEVDSFTDLNKKLSGYSYPFELLFVNNKFKKYLDGINDKLKSIDILTPIDSFPVLVYSQILLPDGSQTNQFSTVLPKPEGLSLTPSTPETPSVPSVPSTPSTPGTPNIPTTPSIPVTPPSAPEVPTITTPSSNKTKNYTSIEAVKNDDPNVSNTPSGEQIVIISDRFIAKEDIGKSFRDGTLSAIKSEEVENKTGSPPPTPKEDVNKKVGEKEAEELRKKTEAQRKFEDADSFEKEKPKEKAETAPSGPSKTSPDGKEAKKDENSQPIPQDKKPDTIREKNPKSGAKKFTSWSISDGLVTDDQTSNFIYYRGTKENKYPKPVVSRLSTDGTKLIPIKVDIKKRGYEDVDPNRPEIDAPPITQGVIRKYKSLFNFGKSLTKIFEGYTPKSPVDVALLMNTEVVGQFNKNWPYTFEEGSEIHLAMIRNSNVSLQGKGGFGTYNLPDKDTSADLNWSANPHWCGLCTNFMLYTNSIYKSDPDIDGGISFSIIGTGRVEDYYKESPFNVIKGSGESEKISSKYSKQIKSKETTISGNKKNINKKTKKLQDEKKKADKKKEDELQKTDTTELAENPSLQKKIDGFYVTVKSLEAEIDALERVNQELNLKIEELKNSRDTELKNISGDEFNLDNNVALFYEGTHWDSNGMMPKGIDLLEKIKLWPGGYVVRRKVGSTSGHVETLLHITKTGKFYTIGGNTGLDGASGNGSQYGFKSYNTIKDFCGSYESFYILKRGTLAPYTNGIGVSVKKTELYDKYVGDLSTDTTLSSIAYNNILRHIMGV